MHEIDRHSVILSAVQDRSVVTVPDLCTLTGASEATIRRDINTLDENKKLRRVRGGAEALTSTTRNTILLSGGVIYREQNIILSPFDNDVTRNFYAKRMFMGAQGIGPLGLMEQDPLLIQAEQKLIGQAEELVVLADSSKFANRSSLILCPLTDITTIITDDGIDDRTAAMLEAADINLVVVSTNTAQKSGAAS